MQLPSTSRLVQAPLAPLEKTLNELPSAAVMMLLNSHPPAVFWTSLLYFAIFGRKKTSLATKMLGRLMLVLPLSRPGLYRSVVASWLTLPDELSSSTLPIEWLHVYAAWKVEKLPVCARNSACRE